MKKVIRITENDLIKIVNRIVENTSGIDIAKNAIMLGVFGKNAGSSPSSSSSSASSGTTQNAKGSNEADIIKKAASVGVSSGEWSRNQSTSPTLQLFYKKSASDKKWTPLVQTSTPSNIKRTNGKWSITNNKLTITD